MKRTLVILLLALPLAAQGPKLQFNLDHLASRAIEKVTVSLDGSLLRLGSKFLPDDDPDSAKAKKVVEGLSAIYVRSFEFDKDNAFSTKDYEAIQKQLEAPGWSCIVSVRSKKAAGSDADICLFQKDGKIGGLAILAVDPREITVVNIIGSITPDQLKDLKTFGVPDVTRMEKNLDKKDSKKTPSKGKDDEDL